MWLCSDIDHETVQRSDLDIAQRLARGAVSDVLETVCWGLKIPPVFISLFGAFVTGCSTPIQAALVRYAISPLFRCSLPKMSLPTFGGAKPLSWDFAPHLKLADFTSDEGHRLPQLWMTGPPYGPPAFRIGSFPRRPARREAFAR